MRPNLIQKNSEKYVKMTDKKGLYDKYWDRSIWPVLESYPPD